jgi:hypothetical protein
MPRRLPSGTPLLAFGPENLSVGGREPVSATSIYYPYERQNRVLRNVEIWPDVITTGLHACCPDRTDYRYREQVLDADYLLPHRKIGRFCLTARNFKV